MRSRKCIGRVENISEDSLVRFFVWCAQCSTAAVSNAIFGEFFIIIWCYRKRFIPNETIWSWVYTNDGQISGKWLECAWFDTFNAIIFCCLQFWKINWWLVDRFQLYLSFNLSSLSVLWYNSSIVVEYYFLLGSGFGENTRKRQFPILVCVKKR